MGDAVPPKTQIATTKICEIHVQNVFIVWQKLDKSAGEVTM